MKQILKVCSVLGGVYVVHTMSLNEILHMGASAMILGGAALVCTLPFVGEVTALGYVVGGASAAKPTARWASGAASRLATLIMCAALVLGYFTYRNADEERLAKYASDFADCQTDSSARHCDPYKKADGTLGPRHKPLVCDEYDNWNGDWTDANDCRTFDDAWRALGI